MACSEHFRAIILINEVIKLRVVVVLSWQWWNAYRSTDCGLVFP